jgi:hypothetical protein
MNANDINPAVISVIEEPINGFGTSALVILSRMAENDISTREKPIDIPKL